MKKIKQQQQSNERKKLINFKLVSHINLSTGYKPKIEKKKRIPKKFI